MSMNFHSRKLALDHPRLKRGFTLLETVVAVGLFAVIMLVTVGAMLEVTKAQTKADRIREVQDNLRFTLESMTREMRTGKSYKVFTVSGGPPGLIQSTDPGTRNGTVYDETVFVDQEPQAFCYYFDQTQHAIRKTVTLDPTGPCHTAYPNAPRITSPNISIDNLSFLLIGGQGGPTDGQPRMTILIDAHSTDPNLATVMHIQTTVTQRLRDN